MIIEKLDPLLNDSEINYLCDLFLSNLGFDRTSKHYRYFRNAVIVASRGFIKPADIYTRLADCAGIERAEFMKHLRSALAALPVPIHEAYNSAYVVDGEARSPVMQPGNIDNTIVFLGTVFMYIVVSNYPKYELIIDNKKMGGTD